MKRLFRKPKPGFSEYAALALFAVTFLATAVLVLVPEEFATRQTDVAQQSAN